MISLFKNFFDQNKITVKEFCKQNNFNYAYFRQIINGFTRPSPELALRIEKATRGAINRLEILYSDEFKK